MFDSTTYKSETRVTPITQIIEKSITPDKVTEMYDKVKTEVENTIIRSFIISDSLFDASVVVFYDPQTAQYKLKARLTLNGEEVLVEENISDVCIIKTDNIYKIVQQAYFNALLAKVLPRTFQVLSEKVKH